MSLNNIFELIQQLPPQSFQGYVSRLSGTNVASNTATYSVYFRDGLIFKQYSSLENTFDEINELRQKANRADYETSALSNITSPMFQNVNVFKEDLNQETPRFQKIKETTKVIAENLGAIVNLGGLFKSDRIKISEDPRGVFDFGLASLGLFRPVEFYSKKFAEMLVSKGKENPFSFLKSPAGVVDPNAVKIEKLGANTVYYFEFENKKYDCIRRQRGATAVFEAFPDKCLLANDNQGIGITYRINNPKKVFNGDGKIKLKYASSNKKSYLIYNKKKDSAKYVDIFMPVNFLGVSDGTRAFALFPAFLVAQTLEKYGIQTRISAMRIGADKNLQNRFVSTVIAVPVKDYTENASTSFDRVFNLLGKSNMADSIFAFCKVYNSNNGEQVQPTRNFRQGFNAVMYEHQSYMNYMMQAYKNWVKQNKDKPFFNTKVTNENFQFAIATHGSSIIDDDLKYDDMLAHIHGVFFKYFYYLDFLAIEMLDMNEFVKSIYIRLTENTFFRTVFTVPNVKAEIKNLIRNYILAILTEKYSTVQAGIYSDTTEQISEKNAKFTEKITSMNTEIDIL